MACLQCTTQAKYGIAVSSVDYTDSHDPFGGQLTDRNGGQPLASRVERAGGGRGANPLPHHSSTRLFDRWSDHASKRATAVETDRNALAATGCDGAPRDRMGSETGQSRGIRSHRASPLDQRLPEALDLAEADVGIARVVDATGPAIAGQGKPEALAVWLRSSVSRKGDLLRHVASRAPGIARLALAGAGFTGFRLGRWSCQ